MAMTQKKRPPKWDIYEAAILLDGYLEILQKKQPKVQIVKRLSAELRQMAVNRGIKIDDIYRNENGILYQLQHIGMIYSEGISIHASQKFAMIIELYRTDTKRYLEVLAEAKKLVADDQQPASKLMAYIKATGDGVPFDTIRAAFSDIKLNALKAMLDTERVVLINGKYYDKDNIEDFEEAAEIILATLQSQFLRYGGYTSAKMLYDELHVRLEDFFFNNGGFESSVEIYDITRHLFEKIKHEGNAYIFADNKHIWEREPDYPKSYLGILSHWARQQHDIMTRNEMLEKLNAMGSTSPAATFSYLMLNEKQNPAEKTFLMYDVYRYVLTEACHIDDSFLLSLRMNLEVLFAGDDYVAFDDIDELFYTTLPDLPSGVIWSPHMIKSILAFFDVGFFTVAVGSERDIKVPDAAIVRKNSIYKSFSDILWSEINRDYELPQDFSASDFRQILLRKGFIREHEKIYNVHTTVEGDLRYLWTDNNSHVTVSKQ